MEKSTAETIVNVYAVLAWIGAAVLVFSALALFIWGSAVSLLGFWGNSPEDVAAGGVFAGLSVFLAILFVALGVFYVFVGIGLWKRQSWARIAAIVVSAISLLSFPFGTIVGALGIWLFGFEPTVKGLFPK